MPIRLVDRRTARQLPWKNGQGVTLELAIAPPGAGLDDFDWRISSARVDLPERGCVEGPLAVSGVLGHPCPPGGGVWQEHGRSIGLYAEELPRSRPCAIEHIGATDRG